MTPEPNDHRRDAEDAVEVGGDISTPDAQNHSAPGIETSSPDADWEVPASVEGETGGSNSNASAPDPSPLMDAPFNRDELGGQGEFWNEGGTITGATSNTRPVPDKDA